MARSIRTFGNKEGALRCVPEAKRLLFLLKDRKKLAGIDSLWDNRYLSDGSFVQISSIFNNDYISITSPFIPTEGVIVISKNIMLYLITIAVPVSVDSGFTEYSDYDVDNLHVCKMYAYTLDEESGLLIPDTTEIILRHNLYTVGGGLTLTMQEGYLDKKPDHYATLSNMYSQEEEIGSINWRAFQAGGGYSLGNLGEPDTNTYWGAGFARFMKWALYGSALGLEHPDPTTEMMYSYAARKGYVLDENEVIYNDLVYTREVINGQFAPYYWYDYLPGQAMFVGIIEFLNPNYRWVYKHIIGALDIRTNTNKYTVIAEDEHELQNYPIQSTSDTSLNWKYHVPIMTVTHDKALMRIVQREGTNKTCWEATLNERLVIGQSESNLKLDEISITNTGGITATSVVGSDTIVANGTGGYTLDGCKQNDQFWTISGTGATINSETGQVTTVGACGIITVTGTCVSCGISASKEVRAPGSWGVAVGVCNVTPDWYVYAGADNVDVIDGGSKYTCGYRKMVSSSPSGRCCDSLSYNCTGTGSADVPCSATACIDYRYPLNPAACYEVYGVAGTSSYRWQC